MSTLVTNELFAQPGRGRNGPAERMSGVLTRQPRMPCRRC
jgi:hypothetical protein